MGTHMSSLGLCRVKTFCICINFSVKLAVKIHGETVPQIISVAAQQFLNLLSLRGEKLI